MKLASVLVAGLGVSGQAVVAVLNARGIHTTTVSRDGTGDLSDDADWSHFNFDAFDVLVASPGFAPHSKLLLAAAQARLPIWSEVELAWRLRARPVPWLAITGTNGKTTTVGMTSAIMKAQGVQVQAAGNVGTPLIKVATDETTDLIVAELSSFQLHYTFTMSPLAAVCLNVAADHLDWHGSAQAYGRDKARIYEHTQAACLYPLGDKQIRGFVADADVVEGARAIGLTSGFPPLAAVGTIDGLVIDRAFGDYRNEITELVDLRTLSQLHAGGRLPFHTLTNVIAAAALARAAGAQPAAIASALASFRLDGHRTQEVGRLGDITFVNDSKATNAHAARAAFAGHGEKSVIWIAGGLAKGQSFDELVEAVASLLAGVVVIGEDQAGLLAALARHAGNIPVRTIPGGDTGVMMEAVKAAVELAVGAETVLLAPAAASMDQFRSYAHRGEEFVHAIAALPGTELCPEVSL